MQALKGNFRGFFMSLFPGSHWDYSDKFTFTKLSLREEADLSLDCTILFDSMFSLCNVLMLFFVLFQIVSGFFHSWDVQAILVV